MSLFRAHVTCLLQLASALNKTMDSQGSHIQFSVEETLTAFELSAVETDPRTLFNSWKSALLQLFVIPDGTAATLNYSKLFLEGPKSNKLCKGKSLEVS